MHLVGFIVGIRYAVSEDNIGHIGSATTNTNPDINFKCYLTRWNYGQPSDMNCSKYNISHSRIMDFKKVSIMQQCTSKSRCSNPLYIFPNKISVMFSLLLHTCCLSRPCHSPHFDNINIVWLSAKILKFLTPLLTYLLHGAESFLRS